MAKHLGPPAGCVGTLAVQCLASLVDLSGARERWARGQLAFWPKSIHVANGLVWLCLLCMAAAAVLSNGAFVGHCGALSQGAVAVFALLSVAAGCPFTREFAVEQLPDAARPMLEGTAGDDCEQARSGFLKVSTLATYVWAAALASAAILQEIGFGLFSPRSLGEIVLCHLAPPLLILSAARKSYLLAEHAAPMPIVLSPGAVRLV